MHIDTEKASIALRRKGIELESRRILMTRFSGSQQSNDLTRPPNCEGFGRIHHFHRRQGDDWPQNPLPIDPALHFLGRQKVDAVQVQVFQNAFCSWRCWYCYVDFQLLSADLSRSAFRTVDELIDLFQLEDNGINIIDLSGGQPDLVPEWSLWFADALDSRKLSQHIYLWSDDNLSTDYLWDFLNPVEIRRLSSYANYGRVGCFKGFDAESFSFNTGANPEMYSTQFRVMRRLLDSGFDVYAYVTLTALSDLSLRSKVQEFVNRLQEEVHEYFPLRTVPLRIREYTPTASRMRSEHQRALRIQEEAAKVWVEELEARFDSDRLSRPVYEHTVNTVTKEYARDGGQNAD